MSSSEFPIASLSVGRVRGRRVSTTTGQPVAAFFGIPYAEPPIGALRWKAPRPAAPFEGEFDASAFGPDLPQTANPRLRGPSQSEDCLYLNVWAPVNAEPGSLPVMVWIHGGGFMGGSGSDLRSDGARMAAEGVVVVSFNYRAGLFGFLAHPALSRESPHGVSGNYGLLDQLLALRWVRDNIRGFGGDPRRVTAFGVSAGSASISLLLTSPLSAGLFQQAALHSPGACRPLATLAEAEQAGLKLGDDIEALRQLTAGALFGKSSLLNPAVRGLTTPRVLRPIRDGWVIVEDERPAFEAGRLHAMPIIVGSNTDEGTLLTKTWPIKTLADYRELLRVNFGPSADAAAAVYPAGSDADVVPRVAEMFADTQFNFGTRLLARAMARKEPRTWRYLFARRPPGQADGPHHGEEVPYVFGNLDTVPDAAGSPVDVAVSNAMLQSWIAFARGADPNAPGGHAWPRYSEAGDAFIVFGDGVTSGRAWRSAPLDFLERFFAAPQSL
jgi:para-nitrobenzyl esterase